ncbi:MAG: phosphate ABC transporter permease subunit PstC, partial [Deltaproteobacteria bacterium]|nr:phosphate ABC transporter permease subunit PstC [Deltaproteobacteria bacterium]
MAEVPSPEFRRRRTWGESLIERGLFLCGAVSIVTTFGIVAILGYESFVFFRQVPLRDFLFDTQWTPLFFTKRFGIWPLVSGTVLTTTIAIVVALPFGLLAAIYLSEFATERSRRIVKPAIEILAGVPTIVYGYFALVFVTPLLQKVVPDL